MILKWHGGKTYLKKHIWKLAPSRYLTRVIPYAGGMQELWSWPCPSCKQVPPNHPPDCPGMTAVDEALPRAVVRLGEVLVHNRPAVDLGAIERMAEQVQWPTADEWTEREKELNESCA